MAHIRKISVILLASIIFNSVLYFYIHPNVVKAATCSKGTTLNIIAHEDDDILFLNPDLLHDIQNGKCIVTVFVTAGDDNQGNIYWLSREEGAKAAYAEMAGVSDSWNEIDAGVAGHSVPVFTLAGNSSISLIFMRLPDGNIDGSGFSNNNFESLQKLWQGNIGVIHPVDGSFSYSKSDITNTLSYFMNVYNPDQIRTQDYVGSYGDGDHSDHHTVGYFAKSANQNYTKAHTFTGYLDYQISNYPANLSGTDITQKQNAFFAYTPYDSSVCQTPSQCSGQNYGQWLLRQYISGTIVTSGQQNNSTNIAPQATVSASSQNTSTGQLAIKAVDGVIDGYPGDYTKEWATLGEKAGAWINLSWSSPQQVNQIVLFDRPNTADQITGGNLVFSDGSIVSVGTLNNNGSATTFNFSTKIITSVKLNITAVSGSTLNVGLSEFQVFSPQNSATPTPTPLASPSPTSSASPSPSLSPAPSFTPTQTPSSSPIATSSPTPSPILQNIAPSATVTASTQNTSTNQLAVKAIDGVIDGYPGDYTKEWATLGEKNGAWLNLNWNNSYVVSQIVLYDRPNLNDQVTGGTINFSDGTSISTGSLNNNGSATTLNFSAKTINALKFTVTSVSSTTQNIGLSEIQIYGYILGSPSPVPTATPTIIPTQTPTTSSTPSGTQTPSPTPSPTSVPTQSPSASPTQIPTPTATFSQNGLTGQYFNNQNLTGSPVLTRIDPNINFNWGLGAPDPNLPVDHFSVRWTGFLNPIYTENYSICATSDDGERVWVNNIQVINFWVDQAATEHCGSINLTAGSKVPIRVEFYDDTEDALIAVSWRSNSQAKQIIPQSNLSTQ